FILNNMLIAFVRNDQNPKGAMKAMVMGSLSNILLDYLFMFPLGLGMFGAAIATSAAPLISMMVLYPHFKQRGTKLFLPKVSLAVSSVKDFFSLGMSALVVEVSSGVVLLTFNLLILGLEGNDGVAAYGIVANLALVAIAIFTGLAQGVQPLFSRYHGEGQGVYLEKTKKMGIFTALSLGLLLYGVVGFFAGSLVDIFNSQGNAHIATMAERGLRVYFLGLILTGMNILLSTLASATERVKEGFLLSMARGIFVVVPLVFVGSKFFGMDGVWMSFGLTEVVVLGGTWLFFSQKKGKLKKEVLDV
ncbi:MAG TPA: MATE family efflux transporter, partial [Clostridiaceae bacterium]|nr:MATE family efflux transporter [Clostridiaceae bacterium]